VASAALQQPQLFGALLLTVPCMDPLGLMLTQQQGRVELGDARGDAQVGHRQARVCVSKYAHLEEPKRSLRS